MEKSVYPIKFVTPPPKSGDIRLSKKMSSLNEKTLALCFHLISIFMYSILLDFG